MEVMESQGGTRHKQRSLRHARNSTDQGLKHETREKEP